MFILCDLTSPLVTKILGNVSPPDNTHRPVNSKPDQKTSMCGSGGGPFPSHGKLQRVINLLTEKRVWTHSPGKENYTCHSSLWKNKGFVPCKCVKRYRDAFFTLIQMRNLKHTIYWVKHVIEEPLKMGVGLRRNHECRVNTNK